MPLHLSPEFAFSAEQQPETLLIQILQEHLATDQGPSFYFGFQPLSTELKEQFELLEVDQQVDNFTRFSPKYGFEALDSIITLGLRQSRFAPLLLWEIFHLLRPGGVWLDLDDPERCQGTPLSHQDFLERGYYQPSLKRLDSKEAALGCQRWQKVTPADISADVAKAGWTFGILTAGQSVNAQRMIRTILEIPGPEREIIVCGPAQENLPEDPRIRTIDLEIPEPRGWITRKKNLIVDTARFSNLCLMHDRFVFPQDFFTVMENYGSDFAFVTFPEPYYPHQSRSCALRYPDYQVLLQSEKLQQAIDSRLVQQDNVYHPRYDDFYETAFCCGGVYVTKKSLWNMVRQDESLYHAECEDILFGLQSQQLGIPHRVIAETCFESLAPHPLLLTSMYALTASGEKLRDLSILSPTQQKLSKLNPGGCKPVLGRKRTDYYQRIAELYNAVPLVTSSQRLAPQDYASAEKLSDFWQLIYQRLKQLPVSCRDDIAAIYHFFSKAVFNWPNGVVQTWIRDTELQLSQHPQATTGKKLIGWGTGGVYRNLAANNPQPLAYLIDNNQQRWGEQLDGLQICAPELLQKEDPANTLVILYSSFVSEIGQQIEQLGPYQYCSASSFFASKEYLPILNLIEYYRQVEQHYPIIFSDSVPPDANRAEADDERRLLSSFLQSDAAQRLLVVPQADGFIPPLG